MMSRQGVDPGATTLGATDPSDAAVRKSRGGRPPRISREEVIAAGLEVGLANLTFRAVAEKLGVSVQALYKYVADRDELVAVIGEEILESYTSPVDDGRPWAEWIFDVALGLKELLTSSPGFAQVAITRGHAMPALLHAYEVQLQVATRSGFDLTTAMWASRSVNEFVQSAVSRRELQQASVADTGIEYWDDMKLTLAEAGNEKFPLLAAALDDADALDYEKRFNAALRALIAGLDALRTN